MQEKKDKISMAWVDYRKAYDGSPPMDHSCNGNGRVN